MWQAYVAGVDAALRWFDRDWRSFSPAAGATCAAGYPSAKRSDLARITAEPRLADPGSWVVACGQQPAVGGGPLLILVKAAACIARARRWHQTRHPCVPLFWCASEDHDAGEANHADLIAADGRLHRIHHALEQPGISLRFHAAAASWPAVRDACRRILGPGIGADFLEAHAPRPDDGYGSWLCRLLRGLFAEQGLVCVEGHALRPLWREHLLHLANRWPAGALRTRLEALNAAGWQRPFVALDQPPLYRDLPSGRTPYLATAVAGLEAGALDDLSPGAALRPILQQLALPCAAWLAGPGEIAYHACIGPAYAALGATPPVLLPRPALTVVFPHLRRALQAWERDPTDFVPGRPLPFPEDRTPLPVDLEDWQTRIAALTAKTKNPGDADLDRRLASSRREFSRALQRLRSTLARHRRRREALPAAGTIRDSLHPRGGPQDRCLSLSQLVWSAGPGIGAVLVEAMADIADGDHDYLHL